MGQLQFDDHNGRFKKGGKGFYIALAVCLVAVGGVAVATFLGTMSDWKTDPSSSIVESLPPTTTTDKAVDKPITNVPDDRTTEPTTQPTTPPTSDVPTDTKPSVLYVLPLTNEVMKTFSDGKQFFSQTMNDWRTHNGVDFKGEANQEVKALADGTVVAVGEDPLWGKILEIDHGFGVRSRYCGVTSDLAAGTEVKVNDVIGTLSEIPCELLEDPHLHLEIFVKDAYVDPIKAIGRDVKYTEDASSTPEDSE